MAVRVHPADRERILKAVAKFVAMMEATTDEEGPRPIGATERGLLRTMIDTVFRVEKSLLKHEGWGEPIRPTPKGMKRGS
jgi:hypothetical protein